MKSFNFFVLILLISASWFGQVKSQSKQHAFSGTMVLSLDGGITLGKTDYTRTKPGGRFTLGIEYYLPASGNHIFGIRGYGGGQQLYSIDENKIITLPDIGQITLPDLINAEMFLAGIGLIYSYSIKDKFFPYLSVGLSNIWFSPKIENGDRAPFNSINSYNRNAVVYDTDLGLKYQVSDEISLKLEGGLHFPNTDNLDDIKTGENKDFFATVNLGISYSLFGKKDSDGDGVPDSEDMCSNTPPGVEVDEHGCPVDSDRDGVPDYLDKCPDTPRGVSVDNNGCPIDSDGDGVPDHIDICPNTPKDVKVDEHGCPMDSDNDGVYDYLDKCPDTPEGAEVNEAGCPDTDGDGIYDDEDKCPDIPGPPSNSGCPDEESTEPYIGAPKEIVIESEASFYADKADIKPEAFPELDRIVQILKLYPEIDWRIEGHTDVHQDDNLMVRPLSLRRAEAILNYFVTKGLPSFQFRVYDMGNRFPIANNNTQFGRIKNRRIVLVQEN